MLVRGVGLEVWGSGRLVVQDFTDEAVFAVGHAQNVQEQMIEKFLGPGIVDERGLRFRDGVE